MVKKKEAKNMLTLGEVLKKQSEELEEHEQIINTVYSLPLNKITHLLKKMGENWRNENAEIKKGKEVIKRVPPRTVADYLKKVIKFAVIGDTATDLEKAPLSFYNPDSGLYIKSERILDKLILAVDDTTTERQRREIKKWLALEAEPLKQNKNKNFVPVGNGIFNKANNQLINYTPDLVFTTKVATNYISNFIEEPTFNV